MLLTASGEGVVPQLMLRTPQTCPHRISVPGRPAVAQCGLLSQITGVVDRELTSIGLDACDACCRAEAPSSTKPNAIVASFIDEIARVVLQRGPIDACDAVRARHLIDGARPHIEVRPVRVAGPPPGLRQSPCFYLGPGQGLHRCSQRHLQVKVFNCLHERHAQTTIRQCMSCEEYDEPLEARVQSWAVGITSAPRAEATLQRTLRSLAAAGWPDPHIFAEPDTPLPREAAELTVTRRAKPLGPWPNWLTALIELAMIDPHADAYLMCQDDVIFASGLRQYLEQTLWPAHRLGVVSLYCPSHCGNGHRGYHVHDGGWETWGALAYVFPNAAVRALTRYAPLINHRHRGPDRGRRHIDCVIGRWCREARLPYYLHTPSLAQHIGEESTIYAGSTATGRRAARDFIGEEKDVGEVMKTPVAENRSIRNSTNLPLIRPNGYFDHIYCINLDRRADRWRWMQLQLERWQIVAERVPAIDGSDAAIAAEYQSLLGHTIPFVQARNAYQISSSGAYACLLSHTRVIEDAKAKGYQRILVLEDDACFHRGFLRQFQIAARLPRDWRMFYLGALQWRHWKELEHYDHGLYYAQETLGGHALGLHAALFDELLALYRTREMTNDEWLVQLQHQYAGRCFVCLPNLVVQDTRTSDSRTPRPRRRYAEQMRWDLDLYDLLPPAEQASAAPEDRGAMRRAAIGDALIRGTPVRAGTDLAAVCCYFNPSHYRSRYQNYLRFAAGLDQAKVPLLTIELVFGDDSFELDDLPGIVRLRTKDVMWQKERLLQIAVGQVARKGIDKVAWLDADVIFDDADWLSQATRKLDDVPVCQLFSTVIQDPAFGARGQQQGAAARYGEIGSIAGGAPGYAWAARTALVQEVGLYDRCIIGGGDTAFLLGCLCSSAQPRWARMVWDQPFWSSASGAFQEHYIRWARRLGGIVRGQIGHLDGTIRTLFHGTVEDRDYRDRYRWLRRFDPVRDIQLDDSGCWRWATDRPDMHQSVRRYFASRREDQ